MDTGNGKEKKQILLRLSPRLWKELAAWAEDDFRSINGQIEYLLSESVRRRARGGASAAARAGGAVQGGISEVEAQIGGHHDEIEHIKSEDIGDVSGA